MSGHVHDEILGSRSVLPLPFDVRFVIPFILLKRPLVGPCSGTFWPNWDGTPAHSSGALGHDATRRLHARYEERGGVS